MHLELWQVINLLGTPLLAIIRFDDTATYALLSQGKIVVSGRSLQSILPALLVADLPARRAA